MNDNNAATETETETCDYCGEELDDGCCEDCDSTGHMSDYAERMAERKQMGLCNF
jgi:hypothetical protein